MTCYVSQVSLQPLPIHKARLGRFARFGSFEADLGECKFTFFI
jgi:hypothetical protein